MSTQSRDYDKNIASAISLAPAARTATANGTGVDLVGFGAIGALVAVGVITDGTHVVKLQDSPDNSTWTDVAAANLSGSFPANLTSTTMVEVGYLGRQRFLRAVVTCSGTTTGGVYGVTIVRAGARTLPQ